MTKDEALTIIKATAFDPGSRYLVLADSRWVRHEFRDALQQALDAIGVIAVVALVEDMGAIRVIDIEPAEKLEAK